MREILRRTARDEQGVALITAMLVSMVVVTLGVTSVTLAMHNSEQSARERERVESIAVAEAGLNYVFSHLQSGAADTFECSITRSLAGTPNATFTATVTFYDEAGVEIDCATLDAEDEPDSALIRSTGTSLGEDPARTMESFLHLVPVRGTPFGDFAVYSDASPTFNSNTQIFGGDSHDGNVYTNDNAIIESNAQMYGDVWAQGFVHLESNAEVKEDVWAGTYVQMDQKSRVLGNARASTSYLSLGTGAHVHGDGRAGGAITLGPGAAVDGLQVPNTPTDPPPSQEFPEFTYDPTKWVEAGYTIQPSFTSCDDARTFLNSGWTGNQVVRITVPCDLSITAGTSPTLRGHLAIISDGSLTMNSNSQFKSDGGEYNLHLIFGLGGVSPCDITFRSNTQIASGIKTLLYTPCMINLNSNSLVIEGQIFGGGVNFNSNSDLTFSALDVPGVGISRFDEDIRYIREIVTE
jgi:Tfp pilus assembly protein PilV